MVLFQSERWQSRERRRTDVSVQVSRQKTDMLLLQSGRQNSRLFVGGSPYCSVQTFHWLAEVRPPGEEGAICFTQAHNLNVNLIQKSSHRHPQNNVWTNIWKLCVAQSNWHLELTTTLTSGDERWEMVFRDRLITRILWQKTAFQNYKVGMIYGRRNNIFLRKMPLSNDGFFL